jgi:hypothetical protein
LHAENLTDFELKVEHVDFLRDRQYSSSAGSEVGIHDRPVATEVASRLFLATIEC